MPRLSVRYRRARHPTEQAVCADIAKVEIEGAERGRQHFHGDEPAIIVRVDRNQSGDAIGIRRPSSRWSRVSTSHCHRALKRD